MTHKLAHSFVSTALFVLACSSSHGSSTSASSCPVGAEGCACTPGGGCDPGLQCVGSICVAETAGAGGASSGGSTSSGGGTSDSGAAAAVPCDPSVFGGAAVCRVEGIAADCHCQAWKCEGRGDGFCSCDTTTTSPDSGEHWLTTCDDGGGGCCLDPTTDFCACDGANATGPCPFPVKVPSCNWADIAPLLSADGFSGTRVDDCAKKQPVCISVSDSECDCTDGHSVSSSGGASSTGGASGSSGGSGSGCDSSSCSGTDCSGGFCCSYYCNNGQCVQSCS